MNQSSQDDILGDDRPSELLPGDAVSRKSSKDEQRKRSPGKSPHMGGKHISIEMELSHTLERVSQTLVPTSTHAEEVAARGRQRRRIRRGIQAAGLASILATVVLGLSIISIPTPGVFVAGQPPVGHADGPDVSLFLCDGSGCPRITPAQQAQLEGRLRNDPDVTKATFESKEQAWERIQETFSDQSDLAATVDPAALPASFRLELAPGALREDVAQRYADAPGVEEVVVAPSAAPSPADR